MRLFSYLYGYAAVCVTETNLVFADLLAQYMVFMGDRVAIYVGRQIRLRSAMSKARWGENLSAAAAGLEGSRLCVCEFRCALSKPTADPALRSDKQAAPANVCWCR